MYWRREKEGGEKRELKRERKGGREGKKGRKRKNYSALYTHMYLIKYNEKDPKPRGLKMSGQVTKGTGVASLSSTRRREVTERVIFTRGRDRVTKETNNKEEETFTLRESDIPVQYLKIVTRTQ